MKNNFDEVILPLSFRQIFSEYFFDDYNITFKFKANFLVNNDLDD